MNTAPVYHKAHKASGTIQKMIDVIARNDRDERKNLMKKWLHATNTLLGMPVKTLKMMSEREGKNNKKYPDYDRTNALAILDSFLDNRAKLLISLQKRGYHFPVTKD